jgi:hypothetical protein
MPSDVQGPTITDPDNVPETLCDGQFNVAVHGPFATLTFTQMRAEPDALFKNGTINPQVVVRARITITQEKLVALRDLLNRIVTKQPDIPAPPALIMEGGT